MRIQFEDKKVDFLISELKAGDILVVECVTHYSYILIVNDSLLDLCFVDLTKNYFFGKNISYFKDMKELGRYFDGKIIDRISEDKVELVRREINDK